MSNLLLRMETMVRVRPVDIENITSIDMTIKNTLKNMLDNDRQALAFIKRGYDAIPTGDTKRKEKQLAKVLPIITPYAVGCRDAFLTEKLNNAAMGVLTAPNDWKEGDYLDVIPCELTVVRDDILVIIFPILMYIPLPKYDNYRPVNVTRTQYILKGEELCIVCEVEAEPINGIIPVIGPAND